MISMASATASLFMSIAPINDSSAERLCGGTRWDRRGPDAAGEETSDDKN